MANLLARLKQEVPKLVSFGLVGVSNALVNYAVFIALHWGVLTPLGYGNSRLAIGAANVIAWAVAVTNSYLLNAMTTFAAETGRQLSLRAYLRFAASGLVGMVAETGALLVAREFMPPPYATELAKIVSIGVAFVTNFTVTRLFVFPSSKQG